MNVHLQGLNAMSQNEANEGSDTRDERDEHDEHDEYDEQFEEIYQSIQSLSVSDRAKLVHRVLGDPGTCTMSGFHHFHGDFIVQVNGMENQQISDLIKAIAFRVDKSPSDKKRK